LLAEGVMHHFRSPYIVAGAALVLLVLGAGRPRAQSGDEAALRLEAAVQKHIAADYAGAIQEYQAILKTFGGDRRVVADALWRLGQAQEQVGRTDLARQAYQRLAREHAGHRNAAAAASRLAMLAEEDGALDEGRDLEPQVIVDRSSRVDYETQGAPGPGGRITIFPDLSVFNAETKETKRLIPGSRAAAYAVVSPVRREVAYLSWSGDIEEKAMRQQAGSAGRRPSAELRVVGVDGSRDRMLVRGGSIRWLRPYQWSASGNEILALFERTNGNREIAVVGMDGSVRVLKRSPWLAAQDMGFSPDGRFVAYQVPTAPSLRQYEFVVLPLESDGLAGGERPYLLGQSRPRVPAPTEDELAVHVLNRVGFGPRPGDIERVKAMGVEAYIAQQLHPERIADPEVDAQMARFPSFRMDIPELLEKSVPVAIAARRRATIFERPEIVARQREQAAANPDPVASAGGATRVIRAADAPYGFEIAAARLYRAVHSERQLLEVLVDFWMNHFNVNNDDHQLTSHYEEAIRSRALGRFEDLLKATATHPRMLFYLDNWKSSAPADVIEQRLAALEKAADVDGQVALLERRAFLKETKGLNENFARELLELHTVGVDSGYTQKDVVAVAQILSGWTIRSKGLVNGREEDGVFWFDPLMHVDGDKVVMGRTIRSGGVEEGEQLLAMLASHPSTARFIATKLARRFVADEPPAAVVEAGSRAFLRTGGDIREVVRAILMSPQFQSGDALRVKIKKPIELVASALRAVDATFEDMDTYMSLMGGGGPIARMGERVYTHEAPDGNPDIGPAWMNSNALLTRLDFANRLAASRIPGVTPNVSSAQALLAQLGIPRPTATQIEQTRTMLQAAAPAAAAGGGPQMMMNAAGAAAGGSAPLDSGALAVAVMLGSPQFQKR
jgi:uncharacterized protein (DUF1800 family)